MGFNYKRALGEPLTLLIKEMIESKKPINSNLNANLMLKMSDIAKDKVAYSRFCELTELENI